MTTINGIQSENTNSNLLDDYSKIKYIIDSFECLIKEDFNKKVKLENAIIAKLNNTLSRNDKAKQLIDEFKISINKEMLVIELLNKIKELLEKTKFVSVKYKMYFKNLVTNKINQLSEQEIKNQIQKINNILN